MAAAVLGSMAIVAEASQVRVVRRWLRGLLGAEHPACYDSELLGSELVTNAIEHSDSGQFGPGGTPGTVHITVLALDGAVRVEVTDAGSATSVPQIADPATYATSGRGLRMVRDLTGGRCGTHTHEGGRTVWFELPHPPALTPNGDRP
ncbi:Histidine kinase-like ATPase domain-containing protein [Thermomonospora echinospora]|uniref:Histidine kinase-like ATPase domain-containing protein n=1 Tax=Thermomonospora echinospora TaxID=1992 RepID=A0A1H6CBR8_9ACTN|nr:ATP-binding protein [Thermomonospora echinospora]SEG70105.1 Histidine kinase-like ATPase domain-containing protein [Thermomonospora echinospora]